MDSTNHLFSLANIEVRPEGDRFVLGSIPQSLSENDALILIQRLQQAISRRSVEEFLRGVVIRRDGILYRYIRPDGGILHCIRLSDGASVDFTSTDGWEQVSRLVKQVPERKQEIVSGDTFRYEGHFYQFRGQDASGVYHAVRITPKRRSPSRTLLVGSWSFRRVLTDKHAHEHEPVLGDWI